MINQDAFDGKAIVVRLMTDDTITAADACVQF